MSNRDFTAGRRGWHGPGNYGVASEPTAGRVEGHKSWREAFKAYEMKKFGKTGVLSNGFGFRNRQRGIRGKIVA